MKPQFVDITLVFGQNKQKKLMTFKGADRYYISQMRSRHSFVKLEFCRVLSQAWQAAPLPHQHYCGDLKQGP